MVSGRINFLLLYFKRFSTEHFRKKGKNIKSNKKKTCSDRNTVAVEKVLRLIKTCLELSS